MAFCQKSAINEFIEDLIFTARPEFPPHPNQSSPTRTASSDGHEQIRPRVGVGASHNAHCCCLWDGVVCNDQVHEVRKEGLLEYFSKHFLSPDYLCVHPVASNDRALKHEPAGRVGSVAFQGDIRPEHDERHHHFWVTGTQGRQESSLSVEIRDLRDAHTLS